MLKFNDFRKMYVTEAVKAADTGKVANLITSYLHKHLGGAVYLYPSVEQYKHGADTYTTVTILLSTIKSVRFNWVHGKLDQNSLHSITISNSGKHEEITFDKNVSLVQVLPIVVSILHKHPTVASWDEYTLGNELVTEETLQLAEAKGDNPLEVVKGHIAALDNGDKIAVSSLKLTSLEYKLMRQVIADNPNAFDGYKILNKGKINWHTTESALADSKVKLSMKSDNTKETWIEPAGIDNKEVEEQITYIEKIEDLSNMLKFMLKGATNAVFVAGRGGCLHSSTEINIEM